MICCAIICIEKKGFFQNRKEEYLWKKRQRRIAALLLACAVASVPVSQAFAETTYDVATGVDAQILFPKDCLTNIAGAVTVDGAGGCGR